MALTPVQIIETVCPELASSPSRDAFIQMAVETTDKGFFGVLYPYAIAYMACHLYSLFSEENNSGAGNIPGTVGEVASIHEGGVSISYFQSGSGGGSTSDLENSKFGEMYLMLRRRIPRMGVNRA
jgi:hypothetical protein